MLEQSQIGYYLDSIRTRGFIEVPDAFPMEVIDRINELIDGPLNRPTINGRRGYVQASNMRFLHQTLSWGREIINLYTHPVLIEVARQHLQASVHLSNYRIYRSFPSPTGRMPWHVDKLDTYNYEMERFESLLLEHDIGLSMILILAMSRTVGCRL